MTMFHIRASDLIELGLYDNLSGKLKSEFRERARTADFSNYPEPLCWLPEMAAIATKTTGNILLDTTLGVA